MHTQKALEQYLTELVYGLASEVIRHFEEAMAFHWSAMHCSL